MDLSIVIPTSRPSVFLEPLIQSIFDQEIQFNVEIIVVVNGDHREAFDLNQLQQRCPSTMDLKVEILAGEAGANRARNYGAKFSNSHFLFFIDDDCQLPNTSYLEQLRTLTEGFTSQSPYTGYYINSKSGGAVSLAYNMICNAWVESYRKDYSFVFLGGILILSNQLFSESPGWDEKQKQVAEEFSLIQFFESCGKHLQVEKSLSVFHNFKGDFKKLREKAFINAGGPDLNQQVPLYKKMGGVFSSVTLSKGNSSMGSWLLSLFFLLFYLLLWLRRTRVKV